MGGNVMKIKVYLHYENEDVFSRKELERIWKEDKKDRIFRDEYPSIDKWIEECFKEQEIEI